MQTCVPVPEFCLQLVTLTQVSWQDAAALQFCTVDSALVPDSWQLPAVQFMTQLAPTPQLTWQSFAPLQLVVQLELVQFTWHMPFAGQFIAH